MNSTKAITVFCLLALLGLILLQPEFVGPEAYMYQASAESVVSDGDLNIANQLLEMKRPMPVVVSATLNYPGLFNHGGVVLWLPFVVIAKLFSWLDADYGVGSGPLLSYLLSLSSYLCGLLALLIIYQIALKFTACRKSSLVAVLSIFAGTPMLYYTLIEPGQANSCALFASAVLLFTLLELNFENCSSWAILGGQLALCHIIKVDLWPMTGFVGMLLWYRWRHGALNWRYMVCFCCSFLVLYLFKMENDLIRLGRIALSEVAVANTNGFYLFSQLFSPYRGYFYYSPIYFFSLLVGGWLLLRRHEYKTDPCAYPTRFILVAMCATILIKLLLISFRFNWNGGTFGGRILMTEIPFFVFFMALFLSSLSKARFKFVSACIIGMVLWNVLKIAEFRTANELVLPLWNHLIPVSNLYTFMAEEAGVLRQFINFMAIVAAPSSSMKKMLLAINILILVAPLIYWSAKISNTRRIYCFTVYGAVLYVTISLFNFVNNKTNSKYVADNIENGNFQVVDYRLYAMEENLISLNENISYYRFVGDTERVNRFIKARNALIETVDDNYRRARPELFNQPGI